MSDPKEPENFSFADAMEGVTRHNHDKADIGKKTNSSKSTLNYRRDAAAKESEQVIDNLSTEAVDIVESNDELLFAAPGVQLRVIKRLRKGHIPWQQGIDLHGMTVEQARDQLSFFIHDAQRNQQKAVLVVHGKAFSQAGQNAVIKSYVNDWLRQMSSVLAFASAQPKDGGTGALYVLLRSSKN